MADDQGGDDDLHSPTDASALLQTAGSGESLDESDASETGFLLGGGAVNSSRTTTSSHSRRNSRSTPSPQPQGGRSTASGGGGGGSGEVPLASNSTSSTNSNASSPPSPPPPSNSSTTATATHHHPLQQQQNEPSTTNTNTTTTDPTTVTLRVKTLDSKEHLLSFPPTGTVSELKTLIATTLPGAEGKFLRLILQGKLMSPDTAPLTTFRVTDRAVVHCVFSDRPPQAHIGIDLESLGPVEYPEVNDDPALRRGFDRLRTHGFTIQEVAALRSYFNAQVLVYAARQPPREGESVEERRVRMEEEWMARQREGSEFALNTNRVMATRAVFASVHRPGMGEETRVLEQGAGTTRDFVWGFLLGATLGFISLFWLWNIPQTHTQKMGIIAGVSCSLALNIVRREAWNNEMENRGEEDGNNLPGSFGEGGMGVGAGAAAAPVAGGEAAPPPASGGVGQ